MASKRASAVHQNFISRSKLIFALDILAPLATWHLERPFLSLYPRANVVYVA